MKPSHADNISKLNIRQSTIKRRDGEITENQGENLALERGDESDKFSIDNAQGPKRMR